MLLLGLPLAHAGNVALTVSVDAAGTFQVLDAVHTTAGPSPLSPGAELVVRDASGELQASYDLPELRERSVIYAEGGGAKATLTGAVGRVVVPWPDEAHSIGLGAQRLEPHPPIVNMLPETLVEVNVGDDADRRLDMLFLGDGYTEEQLGDFADDVDWISGHLLTVEPFASYTGLVNVWRLDQASNESGADHPELASPTEADTAYGCYYGCYDIDRLLCCDDAQVVSAITSALPDAEGVIVLVNDDTYGGAGGYTYATSYVGSAGHQVAAHEIAHSLVGLWDEYSYGYSGSGGDGPNCSESDDGSAWEEWLDEADVSAHRVCSYTNYYRPTDDSCMMNALQDRFCPVCGQMVVREIYAKLPALIVDPVPDDSDLTLGADDVQTFSATVLGPDDGAMDHTWTFEGTVVSTEESYTMSDCPEDGELILTVTDPTDFVRSDPDGALTDMHSWLLSCPDGTGWPDDSGGADGSGSEGGGSEGGGGVGGVDHADDDDEVRVGRCGCAAGGAAGGSWLLLAAVLFRRRGGDSPQLPPMPTSCPSDRAA